MHIDVKDIPKDNLPHQLVVEVGIEKTQFQQSHGKHYTQSSAVLRLWSLSLSVSFSISLGSRVYLSFSISLSRVCLSLFLYLSVSCLSLSLFLYLSVASLSLSLSLSLCLISLSLSLSVSCVSPQTHARPLHTHSCTMLTHILMHSHSHARACMHAYISCMGEREGESIRGAR